MDADTGLPIALPQQASLNYRPRPTSKGSCLTRRGSLLYIMSMVFLVHQSSVLDVQANENQLSSRFQSRRILSKGGKGPSPAPSSPPVRPPRSPVSVPTPLSPSPPTLGSDLSEPPFPESEDMHNRPESPPSPTGNGGSSPESSPVDSPGSGSSTSPDNGSSPGSTPSPGSNPGPAQPSGNPNSPVSSPSNESSPSSGNGDSPVSSPVSQNGGSPVAPPSSGNGNTPVASPSPVSQNGGSPVPPPSPGNGNSPISSPTPVPQNGGSPMSSPPSPGNGNSPISSPTPVPQNGGSPMSSPPSPGNGNSPISSPTPVPQNGGSPMSSPPSSGNGNSPISSPTPVPQNGGSPMSSPPSSGNGNTPDASGDPNAAPSTGSGGDNDPSMPPYTSTSDNEQFLLPDSAVRCNGVSFDRAHFVVWQYSLEIRDTTLPEEARSNFELALMLDMAAGGMLGCPVPGVGRRYAQEVDSVVAIDFVPPDEEMPLETCTPDNPANDCLVFNGYMTLYLLNDGVPTETILLKILTEIKGVMEAPDGGVRAPGVVRSKYLGPELSNPVSLESGGVSVRSESEEPPLSSGMAVLLSLGAFLAIIAAFFFRYRYKTVRGKNSNESTVATGSQITGSASNLSGGTTIHSPSPFSGMLPDAYRLGGGDGGVMNMSAILEGDSDGNSSQAQHSDILLSECGYTTEEDSVTHELPKHYVRSLFDAPVLGAQKMYDDDDDEDDDFMFDTMLSKPASNKK